MSGGSAIRALTVYNNTLIAVTGTTAQLTFASPTRGGRGTFVAVPGNGPLGISDEKIVFARVSMTSLDFKEGDDANSLDLKAVDFETRPTITRESYSA